MPKRELSKCREWERERRERLKTCFDALARLLPSHDPTVNPSKLEILQRAATHITDLQHKNKELLLGDQRSTAVAQRDEVRRLRDRVKKLNARSEQLVNLLRTAGLKVPKECMGIPRAPNGVFKGPPRLWSGRMSREKAETMRKQHENELKSSNDGAIKNPVKSKRKRLSSISATNKKFSENIPPASKKSLKQSSTSTQNHKKSTTKKHQHGVSSMSSSASLASKVATVLGPGTLILANGSVVPVPAPVGTPATLHRIQIVPAVSSSNQQVILMPQSNTNSNIAKNVTTISTTTTTTSSITTKLPILRPKISGNFKQNIVPTKIAIPALPKRKICTKKLKNSSKTRSTPNNNNNNSSTSVIKTNNKQEISENCKNEQKVESIVETSSNSTSKTEKLNKHVENNVDVQENFEETVKENSTKETINKEKDSTKDNDNKPEPIQETPKINDDVVPLKPQTSPNQLLHLSTSPEHLSHPADHSELSNDIFASLGGPGDSAGVIGGQHTESMSPTAAFLLAFPLVSTLTGNRISDTQNGGKIMNNNSNNNNNNERNDDDRQSTPTTLLQIGGTMNLDNINHSKNLNELGPARQSKNVLQQITVETNLKQSRNNNYNYFRESQSFSNQQINTNNSCVNTRDNSNRQNVQNFENTREPLISSVLQVSHACLYEQRNSQHNFNNFYPNLSENYNNCQSKDNPKTSSSKNRLKQQNQRPPVNWMTTPDIRSSYPTNEHQTTGTTSGMTSDYFLPPFSDVYSGISNAITDLSHQNQNQNGDQSFGWTSGTNRSVLPTLLGDLALGVTAGNNVNTSNSVIYTNASSVALKTVTTVTSNSNQYYQPFENSAQSTQIAQTTQNIPNQSIKENAASFLSVSSILVGGKPRKSHQEQQPKRHREKSNKPSRASTSNDTNNMSSYGTNEGQNPHKKYVGGYSAEELIGEPQYHENRTTNYNLVEQQTYRTQNQTQQHQQSSSRQNQAYQHRQQPAQQQQQGPFGTSYPPHGEFSALLSAAVVDTYSKTFDSFVHVKPPSVGPNGPPGGPAPPTGFDSYCNATRNDATHRPPPSDTERRRHRSRTGGAPGTAPRESLVANTGGGFSELSFLSMTGAVNSPVLSDDFHGSAPFLTNAAPPPIPTPVASSLTNFNLSAIFPEIHKGGAASSASTAPVWPHSKTPISSSRSQSRYQHQNQQLHPNHHEHQPVHQHGALPVVAKAPSGYCHPQQHPHGQHEGLYGGVAPSQGFPGILSHHQVQGSNADVTTAPTNFSFSFSTP